jgi:hypothetical protein
MTVITTSPAQLFAPLILCLGFGSAIVGLCIGLSPVLTPRLAGRGLTIAGETAASYAFWHLGGHLLAAVPLALALWWLWLTWSEFVRKRSVRDPAGRGQR